MRNQILDFEIKNDSKFNAKGITRTLLLVIIALLCVISVFHSNSTDNINVIYRFLIFFIMSIFISLYGDKNYILMWILLNLILGATTLIHLYNFVLKENIIY